MVSVQSGLLHRIDQFRCLFIKQLVLLYLYIYLYRIHVHWARLDATVEYYNETRGSFPVFFNPRAETCVYLYIYNTHSQTNILRLLVWIRTYRYKSKNTVRTDIYPFGMQSWHIRMLYIILYTYSHDDISRGVLHGARGTWNPFSRLSAFY